MLVDCQAYLMGKCLKGAQQGTPMNLFPRCRYIQVGPVVKPNLKEQYLACRVPSEIERIAEGSLVAASE
jgi:hypothetical protein